MEQDRRPGARRAGRGRDRLRGPAGRARHPGRRGSPDPHRRRDRRRAADPGRRGARGGRHPPAGPRRGAPSRTAVARLRGPAELRPVRRRRGETFRQLADRTGIPVDLSARRPRGDRVGPARPRQPPAGERAADHPVSRDPHRGRDQADLDRTEPACRRRRHAPRGRDRVGLVADRDPRAAVPVRHPGRRGRDADRAIRDRHRTGHRRRDARALPRPAGPRLDAQHLRRVRGRPGPGRSARAVSSVRRRSASSTSRATAG